MKGIISFIPNFITLLNLVAGTLATIYAFEGDLGKAAILIFVAGLFDFLDGFSARMLKAYSEIGKELDSLADLISFGVAPAMILLGFMKLAIYGELVSLNEAIASGNWGWLLSPVLIVTFSAYRLAKFNTDTRQTYNFLGLPTPSNAFIWAGFGLMSGYSANEELMLLLFTSKNLLIIAIVTSLLLVSEIPMFSLKFRGLNFYDNWYRYIFLLVSLVLLVILGVHAPSLIILTYITLSISFYLFKIRI
jgi:CDP-diacylglycerol--serine O-phosphatidyltransferase